VFVPSEKFTFSISVRLPPLELIEDIASRSVLYFARSRLTEFLVETGAAMTDQKIRLGKSKRDLYLLLDSGKRRVR
jgi:hypothetical protein